MGSRGSGVRGSSPYYSQGRPPSPHQFGQVQYCDWDEAGRRSGLRNHNYNANGHHQHHQNHNTVNSQFNNSNPGRNYLHVGRGGSVIPRSNYEVEDDEMIETASSVSASSGYGHRGQPNSKRYYISTPQPQVHLPSSSSGYYYDRGGSDPYRRAMNKEIPERFRDEKDGSEIYVMDTAYAKPPGPGHGPPGSVYSHFSGRAPSEAPSSVKTKTSRKGGVVVETMSAPNPFCPNTKGVCCLLVLINLGLILVTLGFSIVLQLFDPPYVWYFGVAFLIVGFIALFSSLLFCIHLCRESEELRKERGLQPGELYWTHHWRKNIGLPAFSRERDEKIHVDDMSTYSTRAGTAQGNPMGVHGHGPSEERLRYENEREMSPIHSYSHGHRHP